MKIFSPSINDHADGTSRLLRDVLAEDAEGDQLTPRTRGRYNACVQTMVRAVQGKDVSVTGRARIDATALADHLQALMEGKRISKATFRHYRAAILYRIKLQASEMLWRGESIEPLGKAYARVKDFREFGLPSRGDTTSAKRVRMFPAALMKRIEAFAETEGSKYAHMHKLLAFLRANLVLGLRPTEWFDAAFISQFEMDLAGASTTTGEESADGLSVSYEPERSSLAMYVPNAKATHGRGNGGYRVILLDKLDKDELVAVDHFRSIVGEFISAQPVSAEQWYDMFFRPIQQQLNLVLRRMGIKPGDQEWVTLYSTRHQAIANAKRAGITETEIAALFGHGSSRTAFRHYARASKGTKGMPFNCRAAPESIAAVRNQGLAAMREAQRNHEAHSIREKALSNVDMLWERR